MHSYHHKAVLSVKLFNREHRQVLQTSLLFWSVYQDILPDTYPLHETAHRGREKGAFLPPQGCSHLGTLMGEPVYHKRFIFTELSEPFRGHFYEKC